MKYWLFIVAIFVMMGVGCVEKSTTPIPTTPVITDGTTSLINNNPAPIIDPSNIVTDQQLLLTDIKVRDITSYSAVLEFHSNINCTAGITLIEGEMPRYHYRAENRANVHYINMTGLKHDTTYTIVIEATGSATYRTTREFTTLSPIPIFDSPPNLFFYGWGGSSGGSVEIVTATFLNCDGSFSSNVWSVSGYPTDTKTLNLSVYNGLNAQITVVFSYSSEEYPMDGLDKVKLTSGSITIPAKATQTITINAKIEADAPVGEYKFNIYLAY